jgi:hypothetical protein
MLHPRPLPKPVLALTAAHTGQPKRRMPRADTWLMPMQRAWNHSWQVSHGTMTAERKH